MRGGVYENADEVLSLSSLHALVHIHLLSFSLSELTDKDTTASPEISVKMEPNPDNHSLMNAGTHSQSPTHRHSQVHAYADANSHGQSTRPTGDWSWPRPTAVRPQAGQAAAPDTGCNSAGESKLTAWERQTSPFM